jgi:hypothetical protein
MLDGLGNAYANWLPQYYSQQLDYGGKNGLFEPFIHFYKNADFTKTGSGQT